MKVAEICDVFTACFLTSHRTCLRGDVDEPLYSPAANSEEPHIIFFRSDFVASALHEVSHWCIAGPSRREQEDFGYWYDLDRDIERQAEFERFEARPQGLEWVFSVAAGLSFRVSCDNFDDQALNVDRFRGQVRSAALEWVRGGLTPRAEKFAQGLMAQSGVTDPYNEKHYEELPK